MLSPTATPATTLSPHKKLLMCLKQHQQGEKSQHLELTSLRNGTYIFLALLSFLSSEAQSYLEKNWKEVSGVEINYIPSFSPQITERICQI